MFTTIIRNGQKVRIPVGPEARAAEADKRAKEQLTDVDKRMLSAMAADDFESVNRILDEITARAAS